MRNTLFRCMLVGAAVAALAAVTLPRMAQADESAAKKHGPIPWSESLSGAQAAAAKSHKVIFVDFYADWCGPCKAMLATTYKDKSVVERAKNFVPVLINVDKQPQIAAKYGVQAIPTVVFLDARGNVLVRTMGLQGPGEFLKVMDQAAAKRKG